MEDCNALHSDEGRVLSDSKDSEGSVPPAGTAAPSSDPENAKQSDVSVPDPYDPASLRIEDSDYLEQAGFSEELTSISVRRPSKEWWVRTHPSEAYRLKTGLLDLKDDTGGQQTFLVLPSLWPLMAAREESCFSVKLLVATITREGNPFLWPIKVPGPDGRLDKWNSSAMHIASTSRDRWVRVTSNRQVGQYRMQVTKVEIPDPDWSKVPSMRDMLELAFADCTIDSKDHPVLKKLWTGQA